MRKTKEETKLTIKKVLEIATLKFAEDGYANVSLEDIVQETGLTRGAIYHHFKNKKGLFASVFEEVQKEIAQTIEIEAMKSNDKWIQLINGCRAFLTAASETAHQRILLIDGPAVLGWDTFRKLDQQYAMSGLKEQLIIMNQDNSIDLKDISVEALTHSLSGAMNECALWITEKNDRHIAINEAVQVIENFMLGWKKK
ncbi:TetR/AcrR family transcriptional regulator [Gracilibacillus kekensis]|uniref:Transcriptional regulator, TetR family n=1 Tax=Gracilibacillus kekensis TaxID=1027249 RepID=A0A1M7NMH9_9BACI|nr:TetR/AcrR family transcriptional regulator [Gracilibacillus kekensis]SHN05194.1 transcriptional regulator, TetR family [Gracilibacillus kekensis]